MRKENLHIPAIQESLLLVYHRPPVIYRHEAVMQEENEAGWAPGISHTSMRRCGIRADY